MGLTLASKLEKQDEWEHELLHRTGFVPIHEYLNSTRTYRRGYWVHLKGEGDEERLVKRTRRFLHRHNHLVCVSYIVEGTPRLMLEVSCLLPLRRLVLTDYNSMRRQSGKSFIGVARRGSHWVAQAFGGGVHSKTECYIGMYDTEVEAAYAHDKYCVEHGMTHAPLNFKEMHYERSTES